MIDFFFRNAFIASAQNSINRLNPKVQVSLPKDLPIPSIGILKRMAGTVSKINALESEVSRKSDSELRAMTETFKQKIKDALCHDEEALRKAEAAYKSVSGEERETLYNEFENAKKRLKGAKTKILSDLLPEAFAIVREASQRTIGLRHFDVQMVGGIVLHEGKIAEMSTGEGKTLVATLAVYLNALTGQGVHVITVNDYLARRDREWMGPIYEFLGLTVGVIQHDINPRDRQAAYGCDITYGTNNEYGFDYLRDNMVISKSDMVQRIHAFAVVDEVDSILVDEARTPLIISGPAEESTDKYYRAHDISKQLKGRRVTENEEIDAKHRGEDLSKGFDYVADEKSKSVSMSEQGEEKAAKLFGVANLHDMDTIEYRHHVLQSLRAKEFFNLDVDYVVREGKVIIVDEFTGRMMPGRRWSDGLHQAVEAKEGIRIERENQTLATITFQNYFRMYEKLSGMTGTAYTEANEFREIYHLDCVVIPTNRVLRRANHSDCIYKTAKEKYAAVVNEIAELHKMGAPILVGTISIERSELLSRMLKQKGVPHQVLNAKYHDLEAQIVAQAGRYKAVTIATNMAGRGTDIMLGGNAEFLAKSLWHEKSKDQKDAGAPTQQENLYKEFLDKFRQQVREEHEKVVSVGGLHILGTERHESRRIDNQLRGRSGRQGDPGASRFYVSMEDDLMRLFGSDRIMMVMDKLGMEEGQMIEHSMITGAIEIAQKRVEGHNFEIRKQLLEYDDVMNRQREVIYSLRRSVLEGENVKDQIIEAIDKTVEGSLTQFLSVENDAGYDHDGLVSYLKTQFGYPLSLTKDELAEKSKENIQSLIVRGLHELYEAKEQAISSPEMRQIERFLMLQMIDGKWKDHLYAMDQLKEGIGLRAFGQRDPLIEYKKEGFQMFEGMYDSIYTEIAETILRIQPVRMQEKPKSVFNAVPQKLVHHEYQGLSEAAAHAAQGISEEDAGPEQSAPAPVQHSGPKVGRNDPCPCGSGKKYKRCCGR